MSNRGTSLEVVYIWRRHPLGYCLLARGQSASFGTHKRATFMAPAGPDWPRRLPLLTPDGTGHRLRLWPGMTGRLKCRGEAIDIAGLFAVPTPARFLRKPAQHRDVAIAPGDSGEIIVDAANEIRLRLGYSEAPEVIARPRRFDPQFVKAAFLSVSATVAFLALLLFVGSRLDGPSMGLGQDLFAKLKPVEVKAMQAVAEKAKVKDDERQRKKQDAEAAEARRAREKEGKLGRADANRKDTVIPKGRQDVLRAKVAKTGILAVIGSSRAPGSGLSNLLDRSDNAELDQALTGLAGANLAVGRGAQGLSSAGSGLGGGGTTQSRIQGSGDLDIGTSRYRGRKGPNLGSGREKEVRVGLETGSPDTEGGLSREQILRVVNAHKAAIGYCYDKELQRNPHLSGRIDIYWVVRTNGSPDRVRVASSTMKNAEVEGCIERQVRHWQFPKADAETIIQKFPFIFTGRS